MKLFSKIGLTVFILLLMGSAWVYAQEPSRSIIFGSVVAKTSNTLTIKSTIVKVSNQTQIYRNTPSGRVIISFASIVVGNTATARGFLNNDGSINANVIVVQ